MVDKKAANPFVNEVITSKSDLPEGLQGVAPDLVEEVRELFEIWGNLEKITKVSNSSLQDYLKKTRERLIALLPENARSEENIEKISAPLSLPNNPKEEDLAKIQTHLRNVLAALKILPAKLVSSADYCASLTRKNEIGPILFKVEEILKEKYQKNISRMIDYAKEVDIDSVMIELIKLIKEAELKEMLVTTNLDETSINFEFTDIYGKLRLFPENLFGERFVQEFLINLNAKESNGEKTSYGTKIRYSDLPNDQIVLTDKQTNANGGTRFVFELLTAKIPSFEEQGISSTLANILSQKNVPCSFLCGSGRPLHTLLTNLASTDSVNRFEKKPSVIIPQTFTCDCFEYNKLPENHGGLTEITTSSGDLFYYPNLEISAGGKSIPDNMFGQKIVESPCFKNPHDAICFAHLALGKSAKEAITSPNASSVLDFLSNPHVLSFLSQKNSCRIFSSTEVRDCTGNLRTVSEGLILNKKDIFELIDLLNNSDKEDYMTTIMKFLILKGMLPKEMVVSALAHEGVIPLEVFEEMFNFSPELCQAVKLIKEEEEDYFLNLFLTFYPDNTQSRVHLTKLVNGFVEHNINPEDVYLEDIDVPLPPISLPPYSSLDPSFDVTYIDGGEEFKLLLDDEPEDDDPEEDKEKPDMQIYKLSQGCFNKEMFKDLRKTVKKQEKTFIKAIQLIANKFAGGGLSQKDTMQLFKEMLSCIHKNPSIIQKEFPEDKKKKSINPYTKFFNTLSAELDYIYEFSKKEAFNRSQNIENTRNVFPGMKKIIDEFIKIYQNAWDIFNFPEYREAILSFLKNSDNSEQALQEGTFEKIMDETPLIDLKTPILTDFVNSSNNRYPHDVAKDLLNLVNEKFGKIEEKGIISDFPTDVSELERKIKNHREYQLSNNSHYVSFMAIKLTFNLEEGVYQYEFIDNHHELYESQEN